MKNGIRPEIIEGAPLHYSPENELGVVFLFSHLCKKWKIRVERIQSGFPDCVAFQKTYKGEKEIKIEFEYKSKNFKLHKHSPKKCDWLVCWEHNWPNSPKGLKIIELRKEFGFGFNVWIQPIGGEYKNIISNINKDESWSVASQSHKGDLILFYHNNPEMCIKDLFITTSDTRKVKAGWKTGYDHMASIKRVCQLKSPLFLKDFQNHHILKTASFVRGQMLGRPNVSEYWIYIYEEIIKRNPLLKKILQKYV